MLDKTKSLFKKVLSTVLSVTCLLSGTAVLSTAVTTTAALPVAAAEQNTAPSANTADHVFSWDNATVYFLLTDRFCNGNTSNDHSYGRGCDQNGNVVSNYKTEAAFQGGDFAGITKKINEGYFDDLGVNAIWLSAPYEQIHGYVVGGNGSPSYLHYAYHGYYVLDYTESDKNFGTKEEFKTMVDTAHEHGIRIVLDIVMNHAGYNDLKTMSEYDFCPASGWESYYYSHQNTNNTDYHGFIDYTDSSASAWGKWWGPDWIRCGLPGGYQNGSGEVAGSLEGLPDFKTESGTTVGIPTLLKTKWTKEGTYDAKVAKYGSSGTVRSYLVKWLTEWVKEFGVDGFRCDTAKHVEMDSWKALKDAGKSALREWRQNNPSAPGANWTDDFWMTGECFGHRAEKSNYFTSGAFDSMINFEFTGVGSCNVPSAGSVEGVYSSYASKFNNDPSFNMLTYLASHDTTLITGDRKYAGSFLLMCPGGIQIYYGDETCRPMAQVSSDSTAGAGHMFRSFMNWDSMDQGVLAHWQKLGQFRNNHLSVGAGQHQVISAYSGDNGYTFARTYSKNGVDDKIVAVLFASANQEITIDVSSVFGEGSEITNFYDGTTCKVSGGKVTFNSGANGTILLQEPSGKKGRVVVTHINKDTGATIKTETMSGLLGDTYTVQTLTEDGFKVDSISGSKTGTYSETEQTVTIYYTFDTANYGYIVVKYQDASTGAEIAKSKTKSAKIGTAYSFSPVYIKDYEVDLSKTTNATGTVKSGTTTVIFKYNYVEPTNLRVHYYNSKSWSPLNLYAYDESVSPTKEFLGAWPGKAMTAENDGWFVIEVPDTESASVIFNNGSEQEPGYMQPGYEASGEVWIKDGKILSGGKVSVIYSSTDGTTLGTATLKGVAGESYTTEAKTFQGYTLSSTPDNASGKFTEGTITVTYVYKPDKQSLSNSSSISATSIQAGSSVTLSASAAGGTSPYQYAYFYKKSSSSTWTTLKSYSTATSASYTPTAAGTYNLKVTVKDSAGDTADKEFNLTVESTPSTELVNKSTISAQSITLGKSATVTGAATGGTSPYQYAVYLKKASATSYTLVQNYTTTKTILVKPASATTYSVKVKVKDSKGTVKSKEFTLKVVPGPLTNTSKLSAGTITLGKSVTVNGSATGGKSPYQFAAYYKKKSSSSFTRARDYGSTNTITIKPAAATTYIIRVKVKDGNGTVVSKDLTLVVNPAPLTNKSTVSATSVVLGNSLSITGAAAGGKSPYQYAAYYKKSTSDTYTKIRDYGTKTAMSVKLPAAGTYTIRMKVKDSSGAVVNKDVTVKVTKPSSTTELTNNSTVSATSIKLGSSITVTCKAAGGTTPYTYAVSYKKASSDTYTTAKNYSTATTATIKPASATSYNIRIKVKDAAGTVKSKIITVNVTK